MKLFYSVFLIVVMLCCALAYKTHHANQDISSLTKVNAALVATNVEQAKKIEDQTKMITGQAAIINAPPVKLISPNVPVIKIPMVSISGQKTKHKQIHTNHCSYPTSDIVTMTGEISMNTIQGMVHVTIKTVCSR